MGDTLFHVDPSISTWIPQWKLGTAGMEAAPKNVLYNLLVVEIAGNTEKLKENKNLLQPQHSEVLSTNSVTDVLPVFFLRELTLG